MRPLMNLLSHHCLKLEPEHQLEITQLERIQPEMVDLMPRQFLTQTALFPCQRLEIATVFTTMLLRRVSIRIFWNI